MAEDERREAHPHRVRVTDRRRVRPEGPPEPPEEPGTVAAPGTATPSELPGEAEGTEPHGIEPVRTAPAEAELESVRAELGEYREQLQRLSADFDNARKRMSKD